MTGPQLSARVRSLKPSVTVAMSNRAKQMRSDGLDVLAFAAGEPDFDTPDPIKQAAIKALMDGQTRYMPTLGDPETRAVIADKLERENNIPGLTGEHIAISSGGKHALFGLMHSLFDPSEPAEAVIPMPAWVSFAPIIQLAGGTVVPIETTTESGFRATPEQIRAAITPRTRVVLFNSPSNPCGTMYSPDELRALAATIAELAETVAPGLVVVTDEMYEKIVFGTHPHFSIGSVPAIAERTVTINGLSKSYAMTGWRAGYAACPGDWGKTLIKAMGTLQGQMTTNITSFVYPAIRVALTECAEEVEQMRLAFARRAELVTSLIERTPGFSCPRPTGAFYAFPDISDHFGKTTAAGKPINSALDFCEALLNEAHVAFVPGEDFGGCGPNHARISFACSEEQLERGFDRLWKFLDGLS